MESGSIKLKAGELGFDACGIARAVDLPLEREQLKAWLTKGMQADMHWMANHLEMRTDPRLIVEDARSVIVVLLNYYPSEIQKDPEAPVLSRYAFGKDYHKVLKKKLKQLIAFIKTENPSARARAFVDSAPVLERTWAVKAGLGWLGKHSLLITRYGGSYFFIGTIITDLEFTYDQDFVGDFCGSCTRCIEACPTQAIVGAGVVDARKCISYLTIEQEKDLSTPRSNRVYGCDICQEVCPWNRLSISHKTEDFNPAPGKMELKKADWEKMGEEEYSLYFRGTAVDRIGYKGLKRNVDLLIPGMSNKKKADE
jgi:epoxyqueuosine reductase